MTVISGASTLRSDPIGRHRRPGKNSSGLEIRVRPGRTAAGPAKARRDPAQGCRRGGRNGQAESPASLISSRRIGAADVTAWMPRTLAISMTSRISCAVAPYPMAFSMCSLRPLT